MKILNYEGTKRVLFIAAEEYSLVTITWQLALIFDFRLSLVPKEFVLKDVSPKNGKLLSYSFS